MRVVVITPPAPVVTWDQARAQLKLEADDDRRTHVEGLVAAATAHLDCETGWMGRALGEQTLEARFDGHEAGHCVRLPYPPVIAIESVIYLDTSRTAITADPNSYEVFGADLSADGSPPWTGCHVGREVLRVRYRAGYPDGIPPQVAVSILMIVEDLFMGRATKPEDAPSGSLIGAMLETLRVWR
ncbi:hypothetical protein PQ455_07400 [Sphingomonas naphthae]|uniref:Phage gp6-like head-tail connector protein n=1 Tax=Sphingomonas naphthae TaxID=1813468 RepID=A0ABY7TP65_9SPHN|nr:hypothetical protein [Sphingomonas naphthae]WCT75031.1 hypothetical protein PQ455_07400 [Sphingomonas naphthae]